jgi:hypothetical protein
VLIPSPETDLNESLLVRGADILDFLQGKEEPVVTEEVMLRFLKQHPKSDPDDFLDSLSLLYALGLIQYEHFRITRRQHL